MSDYIETVGMTRLILGTIDYPREGADSKEQYLRRFATEFLPQFASQVGFAYEPATLEWLQPFVDHLLAADKVHWTPADNRWRIEFTLRGSGSLRAEPPPPDITDPETAARVLPKILHHVKIDRQWWGDPRCWGHAVTTDIYEWAAHHGMSHGTTRAALCDAMANGWVVQHSDRYVHNGYVKTARFEISSAGIRAYERGSMQDVAPYDTVTLSQLASIVQRSKRTLEGYRSRMPEPTVQGRRGQPDEWARLDVRPWAETTFGRKLPERFPASHIPPRQN